MIAALTDELADPRNTVALLSAACRRKYSTFVKLFWKTANPESPDLLWSPHMDVLCDAFQECMEYVFRGETPPHDLLINIPPNTSKSTLLTVMSRPWCWTRKPNLRGLFTSFNGSLAQALSLKSRDIVKSPLYKRLFPEIRLRPDVDSQGLWANTAGGQFISVGTGSSPVGRHFHIIGTDDPIDPMSAGTEDAAAMRAAVTFQTETLPSRRMLTPRFRGFQFLLMQRLHQNDPTGALLAMIRAAQGRYAPVRHICLPAVLTDDTTPSLRHIYVNGMLDPVKLSEAFLDQQALRMNSAAAFSAQYLQNPVPKGGLTFKVDQIQIRTPPPNAQWVGLVRAWDKAASLAKTACYTVGVLMGKLWDPLLGEYVYWVLDVQRGRWSPEDRERHIVGTANSDAAKYGLGVVKVILEEEPGAAGKTDSRATCRRLAEYGHEAVAVAASGDKKTRAGSFATAANNGAVFLAPADWNDAYREELRYFPHSTYKDQTDASAHAFNHLDSHGTVIDSFC